jgi:glucokinase
VSTGTRADTSTRAGGDGDFVLGIDVGGTKIAVATATRAGRVLKSDRIDTLAPYGAKQAVERALRTADRLRAETSAETGGVCLGAGAVSPGVVHEDRIMFAPNIPGWEDLALPALVRDGLNLSTVACANDVRAGGVAEARWGALRDADPGIFLSLGTGIAAAVIVDGRVLGGAHGAAGEIGYLVHDAGDTAGVASGRAPLEEYAAGSGLARRGAEVLGGAPGAADLFASADPRARELVGDALDRLAVQVSNMAVVLDPRRIAVGGGMMASAGRIMAALDTRLRELVPFPPELVVAHYLEDSALYGALALILDEVAPTDT